MMPTITASTPNMPDLKAVINLKIHDLDFPARPSLHVGGWDYSHKWKGKQLAANLAIMKELHVDSPWADYRIAPGGAKFDKDGNIVWKTSFGGTSTDRTMLMIPKNRNAFIEIGYTMSSDIDGILYKGQFDLTFAKYEFFIFLNILLGLSEYPAPFANPAAATQTPNVVVANTIALSLLEYCVFFSLPKEGSTGVFLIKLLQFELTGIKCILTFLLF